MSIETFFPLFQIIKIKNRLRKSSKHWASKHEFRFIKRIFWMWRIKKKLKTLSIETSRLHIYLRTRNKIRLRKSSKHWASKPFVCGIMFFRWSLVLRKSSKHWASKLSKLSNRSICLSIIKKKLKTLSIETDFEWYHRHVDILELRKSSKHWASKPDQIIFPKLLIALRKSSKHWASKRSEFWTIYFRCCLD